MLNKPKPENEEFIRDENNVLMDKNGVPIPEEYEIGWQYSLDSEGLSYNDFKKSYIKGNRLQYLELMYGYKNLKVDSSTNHAPPVL